MDAIGGCDNLNNQSAGFELLRSIPVYRQLFSKRFITWLAVLATVFLTSGGIYLIVMQPGSIAPTSTGRMGFLYRSNMSMTSTEFFVVLALTMAGMVGFLLLESALQRSFDLSGSKVKFTIAAALVVIAIIILEYLAYAKLY
uniref:Uncharacterized protein n=1 Tax=Candidatus Methanomethylicus mesodigestus TaxID=1867258 RepID=A0A7C3IT35_9CREN